MELSCRVIAGVRNKQDFLTALKSPVEIIFLLNSQNILNIDDIITLAHRVKKKVFIHFDFLDGVGKDKYGIRYLKSKGADGIISTKTNLILLAKEEGLLTVQRFFIVDSKAIATAFDSIATSKPDMVEIMPGIMPEVISNFVKSVKPLVIAGGLISTKNQISQGLNAGAFAVSTGNSDLWS